MKNVETSRKLSELRELLQQVERVLLVVHDNPDPDSVASVYGMKLILESMDKQVKSAYGGSIGRTENRTLMYHVDLDLRSIFTIDLKDYDLFLFLDSQPNSGNISFRIPKDSKVGVIDHHILNPNLGKPDFSDIRETYGATATIIYEYIQARNLKVDERLATALYYAIRTETSDLGRGAGKPDRDAYFKLHTKINWDMLHRIVNSRVATDYFTTLHSAVSGTSIYRNALVTRIGRILHPDSVAEIADHFLRLENIQWVFSWAVSRSDEILFSLRSNSDEIHMGELARSMVHKLGTAGGHPQLAGGQVRQPLLLADTHGVREILDELEIDEDFADPIQLIGRILEIRYLRGINNSMRVGVSLVPGDH